MAKKVVKTSFGTLKFSCINMGMVFEYEVEFLSAYKTINDSKVLSLKIDGVNSSTENYR